MFGSYFSTWIWNSLDNVHVVSFDAPHPGSNLSEVNKVIVCGHGWKRMAIHLPDTPQPPTRIRESLPAHTEYIYSPTHWFRCPREFLCKLC